MTSEYINFTIDDMSHHLSPFCYKTAFFAFTIWVVERICKSNFLEKSVIIYDLETKLMGKPSKQQFWISEGTFRSNMNYSTYQMFIWGTCNWYTQKIVLSYCSCPTWFYFLKRMHSRILSKGIQLPLNNIELELFSPFTEVWYFDWLHFLTLQDLKTVQYFSNDLLLASEWKVCILIYNIRLFALLDNFLPI